jgi:hypothetical protein
VVGKKDFTAWVTATGDGTPWEGGYNTERYDDDLPIEHDKTGRQYPHREVAWADFYEVTKQGPRWVAVCFTDGELFYRTTKGGAMNAVEIHILRHNLPPRPTYVLPKECPF